MVLIFIRTHCMRVDIILLYIVTSKCIHHILKPNSKYFQLSMLLIQVDCYIIFLQLSTKLFCLN